MSRKSTSEGYGHDSQAHTGGKIGGIKMKKIIGKFFLRLEWAAHRTDAHLAQMRGDSIFAADCLSRAWDIERKLAWMEIQP